jgi:hypothetical protein
MKNKQFFLLLMCLCSTFFLTAQISVGPNTYYTHDKVGKFNTDKIQVLKKTTTYFVYRDQDKNELDEWKKELKTVWTITELKFISYDEFLKRGEDEVSSYMVIELYPSPDDYMGELSRCNLVLISKVKNKKEKYKERGYFRLRLMPGGIATDAGFNPYKLSSSLPNRKVHDAFTAKYMNAIYNGDYPINNWRLGYLKNYLQVANNLMLKNEVQRTEDISMSTDELKQLKTKTLYVPAIFLKEAPIRAAEGAKPNLEEKKLFNKFKFKYEIISDEELEKKILDSKETIYYLQYIQMWTDKSVAVYNSKTGELVYLNSSVVFGLSQKEITKLSKTINKSK